MQPADEKQRSDLGRATNQIHDNSEHTIVRERERDKKSMRWAFKPNLLEPSRSYQPDPVPAGPLLA